MAYDAITADRIRAVLEGEPDLTEMSMFGGLAFLIGGHMAVSASGQGGQGGLLLRCDPSATDQLIERPGATKFVMRNREMDGWLHIDIDAVAADADLAAWVAIGLAYARSLPPKSRR